MKVLVIGLLLIFAACKEQKNSVEQVSPTYIPYSIIVPPMELINPVSEGGAACMGSNCPSPSTKYYLKINHKDRAIRDCNLNYLVANQALDSGHTQFVATVQYYVPEGVSCMAGELNDVTESKIEISQEHYSLFTTKKVVLGNPSLNNKNLIMLSELKLIENEGSEAISFKHQDKNIHCGAEIRLGLYPANEITYGRIWTVVTDEVSACVQGLGFPPELKESQISLDSETLQNFKRAPVRFYNDFFKYIVWGEVKIPPMKPLAVGYHYKKKVCDPMQFCASESYKEYYIKIEHRDYHLAHCTPVKGDELILESLSSDGRYQVNIGYKVAEDAQCEPDTMDVHSHISKVEISENLYNKIRDKKVKFLNQQLDPI